MWIFRICNCNCTPYSEFFSFVFLLSIKGKADRIVLGYTQLIYQKEKKQRKRKTKLHTWRAFPELVYAHTHHRDSGWRWKLPQKDALQPAKGWWWLCFCNFNSLAVLLACLRGKGRDEGDSLIIRLFVRFAVHLCRPPCKVSYLRSPFLLSLLAFAGSPARSPPSAKQRDTQRASCVYCVAEVRWLMNTSALGFMGEIT